jgi:hypothetical protein
MKYFALVMSLFIFLTAKSNELVIEFNGKISTSNWDKVSKATSFQGYLVVKNNLDNSLDKNSVAFVKRWHLDNNSEFKLKVGDEVFESNPLQPKMVLELVNNHKSKNTDHFLIRSYNNKNRHFIDKNDDIHVSLQLDNKNGEAFNKLILPKSIDLAKWSQDFGLTISVNNRNQLNSKDVFLRGKVNSIKISKESPALILSQSLPEPIKKIDSMNSSEEFSVVKWLKLRG